MGTNNKKFFKWFLFIFLCSLLATHPEFTQTKSISAIIINPTLMLNFKTIFLSIIIEALPFIIVGVFVSAVLNNFVSEEMIGRIIPSNRILSILMACCFGIFFPICECGIIPVARRLVNKGVPLYSVVTFILAAPIINPVVASSTAIAFSANPQMVWLRLGFALVVSFLTGLLLSFLLRGDEFMKDRIVHSHGCSCEHHHLENSPSLSSKILNTFKDACNEFFEMGKYFMFGAFLAAIVQTFVSHNVLISIGHHQIFSIAAMMIFAFGISVCSSADAFIAASFANSFSSGSLLAFMVFGPMLDIKSTLMLLSSFKPRLVILLTIITALSVAFGAYLIDLWI
jgi:hypothetical protein